MSLLPYFVIFSGFAVLLYGELFRVEALDDEGVAKVVHASVAELFAFEDEGIAAHFPAVVLVCCVVDGCCYALIAALEAGFDAVGVGDPRADDVALAAAAKQGVDQYGQQGYDDCCRYDGVYAVAFCHCVCFYSLKGITKIDFFYYILLVFFVE